MAIFIDYNAILDDLVTLIKDSDLEFAHVDHHMEDYERVITNTPYANVTLTRSNPEITAGNIYTSRTIFEIEIAALDLSSKREAVTLRNGLVTELQALIQTNMRFSAGVESTVLTDVDFEVFGRFNSDEDQSFTATALVTLEAIKYSD